jgi:hypothetical protein
MFRERPGSYESAGRMRFVAADSQDTATVGRPGRQRIGPVITPNRITPQDEVPIGAVGANAHDTPADFLVEEKPQTVG